MTDYVALNAMVRKHKSALTRAKKKGPEAVIAACDAAFSDFDDTMYPDSWHDWKRAKEDAQYELARKRGSW